MNRSGADPPGEHGAAPINTKLPVYVRHSRLADELAPMVDLWVAMIYHHQPDHNNRCTRCTKPGTGLPGSRWPCVLHGLARLAERRYQQDHTA